MFGFEFHETMSGTYTRKGETDSPRRFSFTARMVARDALQHLRDGKAELVGTLDMEGFAEDAPIEGTLEIRPLTKRIIRYEFAFLGDDGEPYRFAGQKDIRWTRPLGAFTTLLGAVTDARGEEVAQARVRFDLKNDLLPFLISWKPSRNP